MTVGFFTFISMHLILNLLPGHSFCFFNFSWGIVFFSATPLLVQEPPALPQWDPLGAAGRARVGSSPRELCKLGALFT